MALVDKTRKLKQSNCAFVYGLIKGFTNFLSKKKSKLFECNSSEAETVLLGTANGRSPGVMK